MPQWWKIFECLQKMLREGSRQLSDAEEQEKYFISVTHDEVNRGLLNNDRRNIQAIYFERTIQNIDTEMVSQDKSNNTLVSIYKDTLPLENNNDPDAKKLNKRMLDAETNELLETMKEKCREKMMASPSRIIQHTVPWVRGRM